MTTREPDFRELVGDRAIRERLAVGVGDDVAVEEDRFRHDEIRQVIITLIGIVLIKHIAWLKLIWRYANETGAEGHRH